jgi:hypothetical protein
VFFIVKGREDLHLAEFYLVRKIGEEIPEQSIISGYTGLWYAQYALRTLALKSPNFSQKVVDYWDCLIDPICLDLMEYVLLKWLRDNYCGGWLEEKRLSLEAYSDKKVLSQKAAIIKFNDLENLLKNNIFLQLLNEHSYAMHLPPNTKIDRNVVEMQWWNPARELLFKNKYCTVTITFQNTWQQNKLLEELRTFLPSDEGQFQTHYFKIQIRAKFNRWLIIWPQMDKYYRWVSDLVTKLKNDFDWATYLKKRIS